MKGFSPERLNQKHGCALNMAEHGSLFSMVPFVSVQGEQTQFHGTKVRKVAITRGVLTWRKGGTLMKCWQDSIQLIWKTATWVYMYGKNNKFIHLTIFILYFYKYSEK